MFNCIYGCVRLWLFNKRDHGRKLAKQLTSPKTPIIIIVYAPGWFRYRVHADITDGARNFHFLLMCSMGLDAVDREIALDKLKTSGFWAHGEDILVAMLADNRQNIRAWAVDVMLRCRQTSSCR